MSKSAFFLLKLCFFSQEWGIFIVFFLFLLKLAERTDTVTTTHQQVDWPRNKYTDIRMPYYYL